MTLEVVLHALEPDHDGHDDEGKADHDAHYHVVVPPSPDHAASFRRLQWHTDRGTRDQPVNKNYKKNTATIVFEE